LGAFAKNSIEGALCLVKNRDKGLVDERIVRVTAVIVIGGVAALVNIFGLE